MESQHSNSTSTTTLPIVDRPDTNPVRRGILDVAAEELQEQFRARGEPPMRVRQIRRWLIQRGANSFDEMTDLPKPFREHLNQHWQLFSSQIAVHQHAKDGTHKKLVRFRDGGEVECVLIQDAGRRTACISTQVGCGMACVFCASGLNGVERNLTSGEILEQLLRLRSSPSVDGRDDPRLTHIVVMGMGEPLANLDNLLAALNVATDKDGLGLSARRITISTVGLPAKIRRLAETKKQYHLAVSLHAPNDELRNQIVPTNDKTGLADILDAADYFFATTGRQVTYEYVLLHRINDRIGHATELAALLQGRRAHINLIPFNEVDGLPYQRPTQLAQDEFVGTLRRAGISVKVRKRKGSEIDAACGQLRRGRKSLEKSKKSIYNRE